MNTLETARYFIGMKDSVDVKFEKMDSIVQLAQAVVDAEPIVQWGKFTSDSSDMEHARAEVCIAWLSKHAGEEKHG